MLIRCLSGAYPMLIRCLSWCLFWFLSDLMPVLSDAYLILSYLILRWGGDADASSLPHFLIPIIFATAAARQHAECRGARALRILRILNFWKCERSCRCPSLFTATAIWKWAFQNSCLDAPPKQMDFFLENFENFENLKIWTFLQVRDLFDGSYDVQYVCARKGV